MLVQKGFGSPSYCSYYYLEVVGRTYTYAYDDVRVRARARTATRLVVRFATRKRTRNSCTQQKKREAQRGQRDVRFAGDGANSQPPPSLSLLPTDTSGLLRWPPLPSPPLLPHDSVAVGLWRGLTSRERAALPLLSLEPMRPRIIPRPPRPLVLRGRGGSAVAMLAKAPPITIDALSF